MAIALYARKSIERENSISCETQLEYCRARIMPDERNEKVLTFTDNGFSGGNVNRDGFQKMMRKIEQGKISKVIVYRLDRISRSLADFVSILGTFKEYGVEFISTQEAFDTGSPYGELIVKILAVFAEFERQSIIQRVTQAYEHRSEMGFYMGGRRPYGFTLEPTVINNIKTKKLSPVANEIEHIRYIFDTYAVENVTLRRLMDNLIRNSILPASGSWSTAKLSAILKNPIYVMADNSIYEYFSHRNANIASDVSAFDGVHGVQIYGKTKHNAEDLSDIKVVVMTHEGVVPSDIWLKCQKKLEKNKQFGTSISNGTSWLGGLIACQKCGRTMTVTKGGKRAAGSQTRYFSCTGKSHNRICEGTSVPIYADSLEDLVYKLIAKKLDALKDCRRKVSSSNTNQVNMLKNRISEIAKEEDKLVGLLLNGEVGSDMVKLLCEKAATLSAEKKSLNEKIEDLESADTEVINTLHLAKKWKTASYEERKAVSKLLIHKIFISEDGSVEIVWNI